jgi:hypothetical protein
MVLLRRVLDASVGHMTTKLPQLLANVGFLGNNGDAIRRKSFTRYLHPHSTISQSSP